VQTQALAAGQRICLVTTTSVAHNPRLVKEADSLAAAGYGVRVVAFQSLGWVAERDQRLARGRAWRHEPVSIMPTTTQARGHFWRSRLRLHLYQRVLSRITLGGGIAERAFVRAYPELVAAARREPADLFIAHTPQALPVAAAAAHSFGARLGFDAEDLHTGELPPAARRTHQQRLVAYVESKYILRCAYVSAPSDGVADELTRLYGIPRPVVIHNVFPWAERAALDGETRDRRGTALSLYWYSQVISLRRGLADAIRAAGLLVQPVQLHLRGELASDERAAILALAGEAGMAGRVYLHPPAPPEELLAHAAEHDVGLAIEPGLAHSLNNALTVSNKLFLYLLAGLAVAASDTPGQRAVLSQIPAAGALYSPGDHQALAAILRRWQTDGAALATARQAALAAARARWCWEHEQGRLLDQVEALLGAACETGRDRRG